MGAAIPEPVPPAEAVDETPVETGNFPFPDDGPQDDVAQGTDPAFEPELIDGADLEPES